MRLRLLILVLMLACAGIKAQTALNVQYFFSNYTTQSAAVKLITLTPLQPFGNYGGTNLVPIPMSRVTDASGQYTFTNVVAGYTYSISLFDGSKYYIQTNGFPAGLTGTVNGAAYTGIYLAPNFYYAVFTNQTFSTNLVINYSTNVFNVTNNLSGTNIFIAAGTNILVQTNGGVYTVNAPFQSTLTNGITAAAYLATNTIVFTNLLPALTNGLVSANVTNGLATINYVNAITNGLVASTITNGLATTNFALASIAATNGANLAATTNLIALATNGLVTAGVTNGLATTNFVQATAQPISITLTALAGTGAFTNQFAAGTNVIFSTNVLGQVAVSATNQTFLTNGFTDIVTVNPGTVVYTNQLSSLTNGFISSSSISGLASTNYVNAATNGLVTASVTNGLQTATGVTNIVFGPGFLTQWQSVPTNNFQTQVQAATNFVVLSNQTVAVQSFANGVSNTASSALSFAQSVSNSVAGNSSSIIGLSNFTVSATTSLSNNVSTNLVLINNASNATVSLQGYIATNQNPLFVAATNGMAQSLTIADLLIFGTKTNIVVGTNQIGIIGGGSPGVNGTYFQTNPFVTIWINTSLFAPQWILQLTGGNFYLQSNGITEYQSATGQGQWTLVNGIAPAPYSAFGSEYRMDGVRLAGNIYATNLTAQSQYWATNLNLPSNSIYNMILAYSVGPTNGLSTNALYSILASSNYASVNFTTNLVAITSNALSSVSGVTPSTVTNIALYAATNVAINLQMGGVLVGPPTNTFFNAAGSNIIGAIVTNEIGSGYVKTQSGLSTNQTLYSSTINAGNDVAMTGLTFQHPSSTNAFGIYTSATDSPGSIYGDDRAVSPFNEAYSTVWGGLGNDIGGLSGTLGNTVIGGFGNKVNGAFVAYNFIAGGLTNQITVGSNSFATGIFSTITNSSVFMYNDGSGGQRYSGASDQAVFYLANGFAINTNNAGTNALEVAGNVDSTYGFTIKGIPLTAIAGINGAGPAFTPTANLMVSSPAGASTNFNGLYTNTPFGSYNNQNGLSYLTNSTPGVAGAWTIYLDASIPSPTNFFTPTGPIGNYYSSSLNFSGVAAVSYTSLTVTNPVNYFGSFTGNGSGLTNVNATTATNGPDGSAVLTTNQISNGSAYVAGNGGGLTNIQMSRLESIGMGQDGSPSEQGGSGLIIGRGDYSSGLDWRSLLFSNEENNIANGYVVFGGAVFCGDISGSVNFSASGLDGSFIGGDFANNTNGTIQALYGSWIGLTMQPSYNDSVIGFSSMIDADLSFSTNIVLSASDSSVICLDEEHSTNVSVTVNRSAVFGHVPNNTTNAVNDSVVIWSSNGPIGFNTNGFFGLGTGITNTAGNGYADKTITNGLATITYVNTATNGLVTASVTNGLATLAAVTAATNTISAASITGTLTNNTTGVATSLISGSSLTNVTIVSGSISSPFLISSPVITNAIITNALAISGNGQGITNINSANNGLASASALTAGTNAAFAYATLATNTISASSITAGTLPLTQLSTAAITNGDIRNLSLTNSGQFGGILASNNTVIITQFGTTNVLVYVGSFAGNAMTLGQLGTASGQIFSDALPGDNVIRVGNFASPTNRLLIGVRGLTSTIQITNSLVGITGTASATAGFNIPTIHAPASVSVGASPWSFTNLNANAINCYPADAAAVAVSIDGVSVGSLTGLGDFSLSQNNWITLTYLSTAPTMTTNSLP